MVIVVFLCAMQQAAPCHDRVCTELRFPIAKLHHAVRINASYWCFVRYLSFYTPPCAYPEYLYPSGHGWTLSLLWHSDKSRPEMALIIPDNLIIHSFAQGPYGCVQRPQTSSQTSFPQKSKRSVQSGCVKHNVQNMVPRGQEHASIWKHQSFRKLRVEFDQLPLFFSKLFCFTTLHFRWRPKQVTQVISIWSPRTGSVGFFGLSQCWEVSSHGYLRLAAKSIPTTWTNLWSYGALIGWPEFREAKVQLFEGIS